MIFLVSSFLIGSIYAQAAIHKIGLVLDRGGKDDKSFNSAAFKGATDAKAKLGIELKEVEASDDTLFEPAMRSLAKKNYDLIIGVGIAQAQTVRKLAQEMPNQKFAIVDAIVSAPNVVSLMFQEHEGSFLVGYIAGMKTKSETVGFIGGMDIPLIRRFEVAYTQGVKLARPDTKVLVNYVGVTSEAWNNPTKARELAESQYNRGSDIIFVAAGASNNGAFDAAEKKQKFAIGVDSNQNWIKPGKILTSMLKRVDTAVYQVIEDLKEARFKGGVRTFGMKDNGIGWALDAHNSSLFSKAEVQRIEKLRSDIVADKIQIKDYYKMRQ